MRYQRDPPDFLERMFLDFPGYLPLSVSERSTTEVVRRFVEDLVRLSPEYWLLLGRLRARCDQAERDP